MISVKDPVLSYTQEMPRGTSVMAAALLSALMVAASVSASACDLSCWLHQAQSDCHSVDSTNSKQTTMKMSSTMDMDMNMEMEGGTDAPPAMPKALALESLETMGTMSMDMASSTIKTLVFAFSFSSCTHEICSQTSVSVSPPTRHHSELASLHWIAISTSTAINSKAAFQSMSPRASPPDGLVPARLHTPLRV